MVVLLAIAGAVAAVLLNRAGSETDRLENETINFADYTTKFGCNTVDGTWAPGTDMNSDGDTNDRGEGSCVAQGGTVAPVPAFANRLTKGACEIENPPGSGIGTWAPGTDMNGDGDTDDADEGTCG